ncbi:glycerophosphodiester phosphodiesterase family protein [Falsihalocynthiibacter arcticus]|uniref:Phosphodiesterase n=1 Tax=Falsihalocynthiibacter arcticus TaxID=1579316 RepID=A0A126UX71_9RHOB|nr:glycerophosphodiester phosphodiesterase family protein [Falsihalocynthiibacter arcticus]AML50640.1 phosphodiesterase [Falsihalocynthiibacter arcticus]
MRQIPRLPQSFLDRPLAHRGLHNASALRPENSRAAFLAAIGGGYGIELDVQLSKDGQAMVFHDYNMTRLTGVHGPIQMRESGDLVQIELLHGEKQTIPLLAEVLALVAGRVPLLVEIKDQDGAMGPNVGALEKAVAECAASYKGPIAFMSFNPYSVEVIANLLPDHPRGLTTCLMDDKGSLHVPRDRRDELAAIQDFDRTKSSFISHDHNSLSIPRVQELKSLGVPVLCWTITSNASEVAARQVADNVTFEQYLPS